MGTLGRLFAIVIIAAAALMGFISLEVAIASFVVMSYVAWLLILFTNLLTTPSRKSAFMRMLDDEEQEVYRRFHLYYWVPGTAVSLSVMLDALRFAGFVWAAIAFWYGYHIHGALCVAFYFLVGGLAVKLSPVVYVGSAAQRGDNFAMSQLNTMEIVQMKREAYGAEFTTNYGPLQRLREQSEDWPTDQAEAAEQVLLAALNGEEFDEFFEQLTPLQIETVVGIIDDVKKSEMG